MTAAPRTSVYDQVLRSRFGRRLLLVFVACAIVPLSSFGALAFTQVTGELVETSRRNLHANTKSAGMELAARLSWLTNRLNFVTGLLRRGQEGEALLADPAVRDSMLVRFRSLSLHRGNRSLAILGPTDTEPQLDAGEREHLLAGKWLVRVLHDAKIPCLQFVHSLESVRAEDRGYVVAVAGPEQVLDPELLRGRAADVTLLDPELRTVMTTGASPSQEAMADALRSDPTSGSIEWETEDGEHISRYWRVFLEPQYGRDWLVVQTVARGTALEAVQSFHATFVAVTVVALILVMAIALTRVRRVLQPVRRLVETTRRVQAGDFGARAGLIGDDEFAELGTNFDRMTSDLVEHLRRREQTEKELVAARDSALEAARAKAEFLTNVSHELRTPLTSILSAADILQNFGDEDPSARKEFLGILVDQSDRLKHLIDGVLQLHGEPDAPFRLQSVPDSIRTAIAAFPQQARARVVTEFPVEDPCVLGDTDRLQRLWRNLLDNALKFSPEDAPVRVRVTARGANCSIEVVDRGRGIPKEEWSRVFEPFHQGDRDILTDKASGLGLGLTLAHDVVERHGGRIEVQSELGRGSTFRVLLPMAAAPVPALARS